MGYCFLCKILGIIYKDEQRKQELFQYSQNGTAMPSEKVEKIRDEFVEFAHDVKSIRHGLWKKLDGVWQNDFWLQNNNNTELSTKDFFSDIQAMNAKNSNNSIKSMFNNLLCNQKGTSNTSLAGIAMTIVLAAGYTQNQTFYIGSYEIRQILTISMKCLGYDNAEFLPKRYYAITNGYMMEDMLQVLLVVLYGTLKVNFPHKKNMIQVELNRQNAQNTVSGLMRSSYDSEIISALGSSCYVAEICKAMTDALREYAEDAEFPEAKKLALNTFYEIPKFEPIGNSVAEILRCDYNASVRSLVLGKMGSGKSLLTKAVIQTCLPPYNEDYAKALGLDSRRYFPLVLNCRKLSSEHTIENIDLIKEAVFQLYSLTQSTEHHSGVQHWEDFSDCIFEYYQDKAENAELLLIVEDIACLDWTSREVLLGKLRTAEISRLNILVVTQRLINSQMSTFNRYNQAEIVPLCFSLPEKISTFVGMGIGKLSTEDYLTLLNNNRHIRAFVDRPKHLIQLLCYDFREQFNWDEFLTHIIEQTIAENITDLYHQEVTDTGCQEFLTFLATGIAENAKNPNFPMSYCKIPQNILERKNIFKDDTNRFNVIWQYILENMILIYPNSGISNYTFANPILYHSLIAEYYWKIFFEAESYQNWLVRFNHLSAEDFSTVVVILLRRLAKEKVFETYKFEEVLLTLFQSVAGYSISRSDPTELFFCLLALQDILADEQLKRIPKRLLDILQDTYAIGHGKFIALSDDVTRKQSLTEPYSYH